MNRRLLAAIVVFLVGELVLVVGGDLAGLDRQLARRTMLFAGGLYCGGVGVAMSPALLVPAVGYSLA